jgi:hypothetical protein
MGARSGGSGSGFGGGSGMTRSDVIAKYPQLMTKVKDAAVRDELIQGIQEMENEFGVTPKDLKFINRKGNIAGSQSDDGTTTINLKNLGDHAESVKVYGGGYHPQGTERNPAKATMVHEMAHAIENKSKNWSPKSKFNQELDKAYKSFISGWSQGKKNNPAAHSLGGYSTTSKHEYFAEAISGYKAGLKNQYTTAAWKLAKKYK